MTELHLRKFRPEDSAAIGQLFYETIRAINSRDYSAKEIAAWVPTVPPPDWALLRAKTRDVFVAEDSTGLLGFVELRGQASHLDCLYVRYDAQGRGIASTLLRTVEARAWHLGLRHLRTEASITARPFFERRGFRLLVQQQVERNGVKLVNFRMEKTLTAIQSAITTPN